MEKIWLKSYPTGVPAEIDANRYKSVVEVFDESVRKYADRPAYHNMGRTITFRDLEKLSRDFGAWLQSQGLAKGARVALMMPNVLQYPICIFGVLRAGYTVVNVNPLYTPRELEHQLKDSGAEVVVILENFATTLQQVLKNVPVKHVVVASLGDMLGLKGVLVNLVVRHVKKMVPAYDLPGLIRFNVALGQGAQRELQHVEVGPDDIAFLQYTGGTTGVAKGAMLLHRNIVANLEQVAAWFSPVFGDTTIVVIAPLPLYHIFCLTANCLVFMKLGGCNVLITNPRDIPGMVKELANHKFHAITGVNTLFNALLNNPDFVRLDFSNLKLSIGGGMQVQKAVAERWKEVTGTPLVEGYGLTETSPVATANPLTAHEYSGAIGLPVPSTDVVFKSEDGHLLQVNEIGELCIKGPQVMKGYWQRPDDTARAIDKDGYFATGDIGYMDDKGYIRIVDRKKDMVLVSGFNVYPNEVEGVVAGHPGVLECAVIGVPDEKSGEIVKLFVVKKDPALTEADVRKYCEQHLTNYKRPRFIEFRDELPKTNVGKILRRALRDEELAKRKKAA